jgi:uncharacterized membrane protein YdjX (TVP38/TMEM64 family)
MRSMAMATAVTVGIAWLGRTVDPTHWLTADGLRATVHADEWYGPILYVATFMLGVYLPIPKIVLLGLAGALFGPWRGFVCAWVGQVLGMTVLFLLARGILRDTAQDLLHRHLEATRRIDGLLEQRGFQVVALLRLFYFMTGTAVGVIPAVALAVVSGDAAVAGTTGPKAAVMGVCIALVLGLGTLVRRRLQV